MPIFQYRVISPHEDSEILEVEQSIGAPPLTRHPMTNEPIERIASKVSITLKHSSSSEKNLLDSSNLSRKGFSVFHKDSANSKKYHKICGQKGPEEIDLG
ncbi:MAG: hypothetical protein VX130_05315 [Verrucomicrobiota bacterium]|nr:hypothetical protein [Verrucomicrobiota bacterium]